ncbi:MAG: hypothetical protein ACXWPM_09225 [Bdellovibrionota bacterium]
MKRILLHATSSIQRALLPEFQKYFEVTAVEHSEELARKIPSGDLLLTTEHLDLGLDAPVSFYAQLPDIVVFHLYFLRKPIEVPMVECLLDCLEAARGHRAQPLAS